MTRPRRLRDRGADISATAWAILTDQPLPEVPKGSAEHWQAFALRQSLHFDRPTAGGVGLRQLWDEHKAGILAAWAEQSPGTRPCAWWDFSAPRWAARPTLCEPRRQLAGPALPVHAMPEAEGWHFDLDDFVAGLPLRWWIEPVSDPLTLFESQAAFLDRHGLLLPRERARLAPVDFEPEPIEPEPAEPDDAS